MGRSVELVRYRDRMALVSSPVTPCLCLPPPAHEQKKRCQSMEQRPGTSDSHGCCWKRGPECEPDVRSTVPRKDDQYYCEKDLYCQIQTISSLILGCFFHEHTNSADAKVILKSSSVGTFLVRNSSDCKYLYTISVKTRRGPTSIRINYEHGRYSLDADELSRRHMPKFTTLMDLIDYYIRLTAKKNTEQCRFRDKQGRKDLPIILTKPKLSNAPSLKHLARTCITRTLDVCDVKDVPAAADTLPLPRPLRSYIKDYPYVY